MNKQNARLVLVSAAVATALGCGPALADFNGNVALTSDYVFRGFSQTQGDPAIQGGLDFIHDSGLYAGVWASNVESDSSAPVNYNGSSVEADFYAGWAGSYKSLSVDAGVLRYQYPGTATGANNTDEVHIGVGYDFGVTSTTVTLNYSPDYFGGDRALYWDIGAGIPVPGNFTLAAHYGITDYDDKARGNDYDDWRVGMSTERSGFGFDLSYTDTAGVSGNCGSDTCDGRFVFTVSRSL